MQEIRSRSQEESDKTPVIAAVVRSLAFNNDTKLNSDMWNRVSFITLLTAITASVVKLTCADQPLQSGDDNCDQLGVLLYEEIGCKPLKDKPDDPCPSKFDCSHLEEKGAHCFFQGKIYMNREALPEDAVYESCNGGCFCDAVYEPKFNFSYSKFTCAIFDCPEYIGGSPLKEPSCMRTYKLDSCCSSGQLCPPFDNIATCKVEGRTYREGQKFGPKNKCSTCVCQKGFNGKYEAPSCRRLACGVEIRHSEDIRQICAPVYESEGARCCPDVWVCPTETDVFSPIDKNNPSPKTCKFGQREIKGGQVMKTNLEKYGKKYELKCDCQLPPFLTCIVENSEWIKN